VLYGGALLNCAHTHTYTHTHTHTHTNVRVCALAYIHPLTHLLIHVYVYRPMCTSILCSWT